MWNPLMLKMNEIFLHLVENWNKQKNDKEFTVDDFWLHRKKWGKKLITFSIVWSLIRETDQSFHDDFTIKKNYEYI